MQNKSYYSLLELRVNRLIKENEHLKTLNHKLDTELGLMCVHSNNSTDANQESMILENKKVHALVETDFDNGFINKVVIYAAYLRCLANGLI